MPNDVVILPLLHMSTRFAGVKKWGEGEVLCEVCGQECQGPVHKCEHPYRRYVPIALPTDLFPLGNFRAYDRYLPDFGHNYFVL